MITPSNFRLVRTTRWYSVCLLILGSAPAFAMPQYVTNLLQANDLDAGVVNGDTVRFLAGPAFAALVPASKQEVCQLLRDYYVDAVSGVTTVQIVDASTQDVVSCQ